LDRGLAEKSLEPIAGSLEMSVEELARGVLSISTTKIMGAVRAITVELGRDPKDFALLAFGGGGGLVAVDVAHELGIPTVVVPPGQGAFSAFGMLMADVQHDFARTLIAPLATLDRQAAEEPFTAMEDEAVAMLHAEGFDDPRISLARYIDVRYAGQEHSVTVAFPRPDEDIAATVGAVFAELHERQYGHVMDDPVEVTTLRLRAFGSVDKPTQPTIDRRTSGTPERVGTRTVYLSPRQPAEQFDLYVRESLLAGDVISGPAVIAEHTATTVIHAGDRLEVGPLGELVITLASDNQKDTR
jgi:N-methylhydantoinase A